jgi:protein TonB
MEVKKTKRADLEGGKTPSFLMGIIIGCAILFVGFEWGTRDVQVGAESGITEIITEEDIEITRPEDAPPPPPPPPAPVEAEILTVVEDDVELEQQEIASTEETGAAQIQTYVAPAAANIEDEEESEQQIFTVVEDMPIFPGGDAELLRYLNTSPKYPVIAQENGIQGRVTVTFVVDKDGVVRDAEIVRGVDPSLDKEALRVITAMPRWTPGKQRGKPVRVKFTVPVTFRLQ